MKKITLVSSLFIVTAMLFSARWVTNAVNAPPQETFATLDTTLAVGLSLEDMAKQSDVIAIGTCLETRSVWIDQSLVTVATVAVSETLKGAESPNLTVVLPGGVDANRKFPVAMSYPGMDPLLSFSPRHGLPGA